MNNTETDTEPKPTTKEVRFDCNETIVTLKLPLKHYRAAVNMSYLLGFKSFDDYVSYLVKDNVESYIESTQLWDKEKERYVHHDGYKALTTDYLTSPD